MTPELESVFATFVGSAALTSLFVILALIGTLNPYHRPAIPVLGALAVILASTYLFAQTAGITVGSGALRMTMSEGVTVGSDVCHLCKQVGRSENDRKCTQHRDGGPVVRVQGAYQGEDYEQRGQCGRTHEGRNHQFELRGHPSPPDASSERSRRTSSPSQSAPRSQAPAESSSQRCGRTGRKLREQAAPPAGCSPT